MANHPLANHRDKEVIMSTTQPMTVGHAPGPLTAPGIVRCVPCWSKTVSPEPHGIRIGMPSVD